MEELKQQILNSVEGYYRGKDASIDLPKLLNDLSDLAFHQGQIEELKKTLRKFEIIQDDYPMTLETLKNELKSLESKY